MPTRAQGMSPGLVVLMVGGVAVIVWSAVRQSSRTRRIEGELEALEAAKAKAALPNNVVNLDDYRGAEDQESKVEEAVGEVSKGILLLAAVGLGVLAYELHRTSRRDSGAKMGHYIDSLAQEEREYK